MPVTVFEPTKPSDPPVAMGVRTLQPAQGVPPPPPASDKMPTPSSRVTVPRPKESQPDDTPLIEVFEDDLDDDDDGDEPPPDLSSASLLDSMPESSKQLVKPDGDKPRNEQLVASLKKIMTLSKNGRVGEAYHEYESLFSSAAFAAFRPEDQRQALRLMILAKAHPDDMTEVRQAHRAALIRIKALVEKTGGEPADQELLGVAHLYLGDPKAATAAFEMGLELERNKNPQSDLVATFMRRVSQV